MHEMKALHTNKTSQSGTSSFVEQRWDLPQMNTFKINWEVAVDRTLTTKLVLDHSSRLEGKSNSHKEDESTPIP